MAVGAITLGIGAVGGQHLSHFSGGAMAQKYRFEQSGQRFE